ncbi:glycosyltransferase [Tatumella ptyseos]|uniref:glycosyltransferase n=1 Tax=Tatumella ptyseos TaxID=82987 RepID=UPI0026EE0CA4|nr:glycosyltransferase [Tatumella ptyseos]WKX27166.1 glycosyltransferase [Tatumella ptyseos]
MKVCIVIDGVSNSGGTDRVVSNLANILTEKEISTDIYSLTTGAPYYFISSEVRIIYPKYNNRIINLINFSIKIKKENYDNVIVLSMGKLSAQLIPMLRIFLIKSKIICNDHVSFESFSLIKKMIKLPAYFISDNIVVLTESDKSYLKNMLGSKVSVVRNSSPYENYSFSSNDIYKKEKIVIAVGRLTYQKNFQRLIRLWNEAKTIGWRLVIIGSGEEKEILEDSIRQNKSNNINIIESTPDLEKWYRRSSLLLMTSRYEGLPMVLIEAKNFALPVLAFDCKTGPNEIIDKDGIVIDYHDDQSFILNLERILVDSELREKFSKEALLNSKFFNKEEIFKQWGLVLNSK